MINGTSVWNMGYRYGIWCVDMVIYHIDMVILDIDMGYGLMIWEMTVSIMDYEGTQERGTGRRMQVVGEGQISLGFRRWLHRGG
jgi:hypothetical protein